MPRSRQNLKHREMKLIHTFQEMTSDKGRKTFSMGGDAADKAVPLAQNMD
jgi:hypothetical protein